MNELVKEGLRRGLRDLLEMGTGRKGRSQQVFFYRAGEGVGFAGEEGSSEDV